MPAFAQDACCHGRPGRKERGVSISGVHGGGNHLRWRKSSYSGAGNDCVEIALGAGGAAVRDSKTSDGGMLWLDEPHWQSFLRAAAGRQD